MINRSVILASRPHGEPISANFTIVETSIPPLGEKQVLLQTIWLSLDPYMRGLMDAREGSVPGVELGQPMKVDTVNRVIQSNHPDYAVGDFVAAYTFWQEYAVSDGDGLRKIDPKMAPLSASLGALGMPGLTAYIGLLQFGLPKPGETLVVAAASGPVGSLVGQIGKRMGCKVVGIAGSDEKCCYIKDELGFDASINHHNPQLSQLLSKYCSNGIDIYFENVGGHVWDAVLPHLNNYARVPVCGLVAHYNDVELPLGPNRAPELMDTILVKRLSLRGFIVDDYYSQADEYRVQLASWLGKGEITCKEDITDGLEQAPGKFIGMLRGNNFGKTLIRVSKT
jgi:NADPH-dependent curcumin reductase CurA